MTYFSTLCPTYRFEIEMEQTISTIVSEVNADGMSFLFNIDNPIDYIQSFHLNHMIYEQEELDIISQYINQKTRLLDIGANVGNHAVYLSKKFNLSNVIVIEPNPVAISILIKNIASNELGDIINTSKLGYGLSDRDSLCSMLTPDDRNLSASTVDEGKPGDIKITTADKLLGDMMFDFIKIDVETFEIKCLAGMVDLIDRCRPTIFVEVDDVNDVAFDSWCNVNKYKKVKEFRRYTCNTNFLVVPE